MRGAERSSVRRAAERAMRGSAELPVLRAARSDCRAEAARSADSWAVAALPWAALGAGRCDAAVPAVTTGLRSGNEIACFGGINLLKRSDPHGGRFGV